MVKKQLPAFVLAFVVPLLLVFWWWGAFASATVSVETRGPYRYAYHEVQGDYGKLPDRQAVVLKMFEEQQLARGGSVTLLFNDPRNTDKKDQKARVGYLIEAGATVRDPLTVAEIPAREVLVARIKAQPLLAPGKAYSALIAWLEKNRLPYRTPTLEIYRDSEMVVEMETMK